MEEVPEEESMQAPSVETVDEDVEEVSEIPEEDTEEKPAEDSPEEDPEA